MDKYLKFKKKKSFDKLENKSKSRSKDDQFSNLPTMNSYKNLYESRQIQGKPKIIENEFKASSVELAEIKPIETSSARSLASNAKLKESNKKNKLKLYYTYINEKGHI
jgi:hypothetical protein